MNLPKSLSDLTAPEYAQAEFIDGFFEREVELGSPGRNSQTDLMVIAAVGDELAEIAVRSDRSRVCPVRVYRWFLRARGGTRITRPEQPDRSDGDRGCGR